MNFRIPLTQESAHRDMITDTTAHRASNSSLIDAERCIAELQRGRAVALHTAREDRITDQSSFQIIQLVETMDAAELEALMAMKECRLILSRSRALGLGSPGRQSRGLFRARPSYTSLYRT